MRSSNRRGLELAANTIVTLIVAVVIMSLAISLTYSVFCGAEDYARDVDSQSEQRIEQLLSGGGRVQVADNTKTAEAKGSVMCGREPVATATYALGIKNDGPADDFRVNVTGPDGTNTDEIQFFGKDRTINIGNREVHSMNILITVPDVDFGNQRIYTVHVTKGNDNTNYGVQQLYLNPE